MPAAVTRSTSPGSKPPSGPTTSARRDSAGTRPRNVRKSRRVFPLIHQRRLPAGPGPFDQIGETGDLGHLGYLGAPRLPGCLLARSFASAEASRRPVGASFTTTRSQMRGTIRETPSSVAFSE